MPKVSGAKSQKTSGSKGGTKIPKGQSGMKPSNSQNKSGSNTTKVKSPQNTVVLKVGQKAPAFSLPNQDGRIVSLSDFKGKKIVLYFYPKDDTPGCTKESCAFRDGLDEITSNGAVVVGVSPDSVASHKKFANKYDLNFPLLSDESKGMLQAYGVWKEKSMYGRTYMGVERTTFIIDENGKIDDIFAKVKVDNHLEEVLGELDIMP